MKSEALACARCFLRLQLDLVSLLVGQEAAVGTQLMVSRCAATMCREGLLLGAQALQGKGGSRHQPTLSSFSCPRMYADTASQIATTSGKQGKEVSGSRPVSSQPLSELLAQGVTDAGVHTQPRQRAPWLPSWAVPQFQTASLTLLLGQGWSTNGHVGRFSQRKLVQGKGLIYSTGISRRLVRALWEL